MMPRQRGVKKHPERIAGPYVILPHDMAVKDYARSRKYIARRCQTEFPHVRETTRPMYTRYKATFGELMHAMRALYRLEREMVAEATGKLWHEVELCPHDSCRSPRIAKLAYGVTEGILQAKIQEMLEEERGSE